MKRVVVHLKDSHGKEFVARTDFMEAETAEAERARIEQEHATAGSENRWIRVGDESVQSKHIQRLRLEEKDEGPPEQWGGPSLYDMHF
jgi:hypothetical protein